MIGIYREHSKNLKRWRDGTMALRWRVGLIETGRQFRLTSTTYANEAWTLLYWRAFGADCPGQQQ